jgi:hypothetical protein
MKSIRSALLLAFALSTAACGVDASMESTASAGLDTMSQAATTAPPPLPNSCLSSIPAAPSAAPTAPTPISQLGLGRPFYPLSTNLLSAYTVVVTDPNDSNSFYAFGFDVRSQRTVFWVSGYKSRGELRRLNAQIADDIEALEQSSGIDLGFTWGSSGQIGGPLIPRPGVHEGAWRVAFNNWYQLDEYLVAPQRTPVINATPPARTLSGSSGQVGGPILPQPGI